MTGCLWLLVLMEGVLGEPLTMMESIIAFYKRSGLRFREDKYLMNEPILGEYDFVVVGAGPAGAVLTHRLTEVADWKVLLLEAGSAEVVYTDIPVMGIYYQFTDYNWMYTSEPSPNACLGMEGQVCPWPAGKGIGGGSILNAMVYTRGTRHDYDGWAAAGNTGWSYDEVLPYFLKSEHVDIPSLAGSPYHARGGRIHVEYPAYQTPLLHAFLEAGRELGYPVVDYHDPRTPLGFARIQSTMRNGWRVSASKAFLKPIRNRPNFHVSQNSRVTRVIVDPKSRRATGVEFLKKGQRRLVRAKREVILSAGAFNSPQILMLSGIGHREHLHKMGIPVIQDLPVGDNLQEHLSMAAMTFFVNATGIVARRIIRSIPRNFVNWYFNHQGIFTSAGCEGVAFLQTKYANASTDTPDVELFFNPYGLQFDGGAGLRKTMGITDRTYDALYRDVAFLDAYSVWPVVQYPRSRGKVRLRSRDPLSPPRIHANFLADPQDVAVIVEGLKMVLELSETRAMRRFGSRLHRVPLPQCADLGFGTDAYWKCTVRHLTTQLHHQSGTCKMGPEWDAEAVVDPQLRVYGVAGLRVADTSIMPTVTGGHTMAPAYMIGEKAADMIKQAWGVLQ